MRSLCGRADDGAATAPLRPVYSAPAATRFAECQVVRGKTGTQMHDFASVRDVVQLLAGRYRWHEHPPARLPAWCQTASARAARVPDTPGRAAHAADLESLSLGHKLFCTSPGTPRRACRHIQTHRKREEMRKHKPADYQVRRMQAQAALVAGAALRCSASMRHGTRRP